MSDIVKDYSRTLLLASRGNVPVATLEGELHRMREGATADFRQEGWYGEPKFAPSLDVRYRGQGFEINVPYNDSALDHFHSEHKRRYGYSQPEREIEVVTVRLRAWLPAQKVSLATEDNISKAAAVTRTVWFGNRRHRLKLFDRAALGKRKIAGSSIITEYSATTFLPAGWSASKDAVGNLILVRRK
jgi:N-methylhydantoinase A